jgi:DNA-binding transcriptional ArsR family regulator
MSRSPYTCKCNTVHHEIVDHIKEEMLPREESEALSALFKVFGDETRIRILWALDQHEMCVCDLCSVLGMTKSAVSHQLGSLRAVHLVKWRKDGTSVYYSMDDEHVREVFETGLAHIRHQDGEKAHAGRQKIRA